MTRATDAPGGEAATLRAYLREIARYPLLTLEQERALGVRIRDEGDEGALRELVESNLRFVVSYAKRFRGLGVSFLDLIHEGNLGLVVAARRYDPARNVKFITYAVWWVRQAIMAALSAQTRAVALPPKLAPIAARFRRDVERLATDLNHAPTPAEIATELDITEGEAEALGWIAGWDRSLSESIGGQDGRGGPELSETLVESGPMIDDRLVLEAVVSRTRRLVAALDPRERQVMQLRFGLEDGEPHTLQEIGARLKLSRERVRQIEARAKEKLRRSPKVQELRGALN